jgi:MoCo/4Fe-4S cofactor protein with predicted Tat translocation signal
MKRTKIWRSLEELERSAEFSVAQGREFPPGATEWTSGLERREFLRLMGASIALAGFGGCTRQPVETIVPYVDQPPELVPGKPLYFASATSFGGYAQGIVVKSNEGRPTKIEGNPDHPASRGGSSIWGQADLLDLYDPDRAKVPTKAGQVTTWATFLGRLNETLAAQSEKNGSGLRILTSTLTSPTLIAQLQAIQKKFADFKWHQWDPLSRGATRIASANGSSSFEPLYDFSQAKVIVALDSDFLYLHPAALRHARDFAAGRRVQKADGATMNRFYAAEPTPTITGSNADHRLPIASRDIPAVAAALAALVGTGGEGANVPHSATEWVWAAAQDLRANVGASVVIAGETQPPAVQLLVAQINQSLGNVGQTVRFLPPIRDELAIRPQSLDSLLEDLASDAVDLLLILDGNPAYDAPVDLDFARAMGKAHLRVHHSLARNETSRLCHWHVPALHFLEGWSDLRAFDGTVTIVQPLIEPLYEGVSAHQLLDAFLHSPPRSAHELVRAKWREKIDPGIFESQWRSALASGYLSLSEGKETSPSQTSALPELWSQPIEVSPASGLEVIFRADPNVLDGRYANNGWLQELPKPFSKITWDNAALVSPALALQKKLENGDYVELALHGRKLEAPVWILPGQAENTITLQLGYGRKEAGLNGADKGYNGFLLRTSSALWQDSGLTIRKLARRMKFATTQNHFSIEGRALVRAGTLREFVRQPSFAVAMGETPKEEETLYHPAEFRHAGYAWGMAIDLNTCIGCNACTIACQAENNIPVVGKDQVIRGREMHWIRVDTYYAGLPDDPQFHHQPVPCMHCEHAPCELVCPVAATVHDDEGLNLQVYNRCVGTRYCSNNCPYKVRRFNFLEYNGALSSSEKLVKNPEVTVRSRGVMEKCSYCLQRINAARVVAELEHRRIRDGEIVPACAQACPADAIVFGDLHDPRSRVAQRKTGPLNYGMLAELNTRPRTTYGARLTNPNPHLSA